MTDDHVVVSAETLLDLSVAVLVDAGLEAHAARLAADVLVRSSLRGVDTHGVNTLRLYAEHVRQGGASREASLQVVTDRGALAVIDAQAGLGLTVASMATSLAIERARNFGVSTVTVRNANHLGAAGHFALMCAEAECIGLIVSNTPPIMAVTGSRSRSIGNSPLAFGAPRREGSPFVLDLAMSRVAGGKVRLALARGEQIPLGWILDPEGNPSTDPADFFERKGALLPMEDHKGYGLSLMVETLAGALSGAAMLSQMSNWLYAPSAPGDVGFYLHVIDVSPSGAFPEFLDRMTTMCDEITSAPLAPGVDRIVIPGELAAEREAHALAHGKVFSAQDWAPIRALGEAAGFRRP